MVEHPAPLGISVVPGVTISKWTRAWEQRRPETPVQVSLADEANQLASLVAGEAQLAFVRLPVERDGLHLIRLYSEIPVVLAPKDHPIEAFESVTLADLAGETVRTEPIEQAIDLVVAGVGVLLVPASVARQHARKDLIVRPIEDAPETEIAVAWRQDEEVRADDVEQFVGIVRGRTAASSRGATNTAVAEAPDLPAQAKATSRQAKSAQGRAAGQQRPGASGGRKQSRPGAGKGKKPRGRR